MGLSDFGSAGFAALRQNLLSPNLQTGALPTSITNISGLPQAGSDLLRSPEFAPALFSEYARQLGQTTPGAAYYLPKLYQQIWNAYKVRAASEPLLQFDQFLTEPGFNPMSYLHQLDPYTRGDRDLAYNRGYRILRA